MVGGNDSKLKTKLISSTLASYIRLFAFAYEKPALFGAGLIRRTVTTQRGPNVSVCMAIATEFGLLHSNVYRGEQTVARFQEFVDALCERCNQLDQGAQCVILMDGPNFNRAAGVPQQLQNQISIRILSPYLPFLNPVELANSGLKARIRQMLANPELVEEEAAPPANLTQEE